MSKKYYWQHEDTGRVCCTEFRPSHRWDMISAKAYRAHEAQANKSVQPTIESGRVLPAKKSNRKGSAPAKSG